MKYVGPWTAIALLFLVAATAAASPPQHAIVFHEPDTFAAWPANGGAWTWDRGQEAAIAFVTGRYQLRPGHNVVPPYTNRLARTSDGGKTWTVETPRGFYQTGQPVKPLTAPIPFDAPGLAMRFVAEGYQGGADSPGVITYSLDRGQTWRGPFRLPRLTPPDAGGLTEVTLRTDYLVRSKTECLVMGSARQPGKSGTDRVFAAVLTDGGRAAGSSAWVTPPTDPNRAVMPSTVAWADGKLFSAVRIRKRGADDNWIGGYRSADRGTTWQLVGRVGRTGAGNGNPPAVTRLRDGRIACAYGDRTRNKLYLRLSADGVHWDDEVVLRDGYQPDARGEVDLGYPRLYQRPDGALVVVYYWSTRERLTAHIAATTWMPTAPVTPSPGAGRASRSAFSGK